jgi:hypothetical protein
MNVQQFVARSHSIGLASLHHALAKDKRFQRLDETRKIEALTELAARRGIPLTPQKARIENPIEGDKFVKSRKEYPVVVALDDIAVAYVRLRQGKKHIERFCLFLPSGVFVDSFDRRDDAEEVARQIQSRSASLLRLADHDRNIRDLRLVSDLIRARVVEGRTLGQSA